MKRIIFLLFVVFTLLVIPSKSIAQTDSSATEGTTLDNKLGDLLNNIKTALGDLRKQKDKKAREAYKKIRSINKEILKALNTVPPAKCLGVLDNAMQKLYSLVSNLNIGISCGPVIIPPFLPGTDNLAEIITPDCALPPDEMRSTPFNGAFSIVNPVYDNARDVFREDTNENEIPDVCEGNIE